MFQTDQFSLSQTKPELEYFKWWTLDIQYDSSVTCSSVLGKLFHQYIHNWDPVQLGVPANFRLKF